MVSYFALSHFWPQSDKAIPHKISCTEELKGFENNSVLTTKQQTEKIVMSNQILRKFIDNSSYCEFMSLSALLAKSGSYQILNINLNDTTELTAKVSLQNNSVASYDFSPLVRTGGPAMNSWELWWSNNGNYVLIGIAAITIAACIFVLRRKSKR